MSLFTGGALIGAALAAGGASVAASKIASNASKNASNQAAAGTQAALDFTKDQKAKQEAAAAPYLSLGQMAASRLPGAVRPMPMGGPPMPYTTQSAATRPSMPMSSFGAPNGSQPPAPGGLVTIQAPDGSTRQVPSSQVQFFVSRGGKVV